MVMPMVEVGITISTLEQLNEVTVQLLDDLKQWNVPAEKQIELRLCFMEAVQNGLLYGGSLDGKPAEVQVSWYYDDDCFEYTVEDNGSGVPLELRNRNWEDCLLEEHGRGILLMQTILDEVTFNERGNRITGRMCWRQGGGSGSEKRCRTDGT